MLRRDIWLKGENGEEISSIRDKYYIEGNLYFAETAEKAFEITEWQVDNDDQNHDGPGDLTLYIGVGIHQLEETDNDLDWLLYQMKDGGFHTGTVTLGNGSVCSVKPLLRLKHELSIFKAD